MQLKKFGNVSGALAAASCALLGTPAKAQEDWQFDTALLYYAESDDRVKATEGIFAAKKAFDYGEFLDLKVTIDVLTGASPTGAVPQPTIQTYTRPSGRGAYQTPAGNLPLDDTFKDTRLQLNGQWTQPWGENYTVSSGLHFSREYDYTAMGFNATLAKELFDKNTTLSAGLSYSRDTISPEGGRPIPMISVSNTGDINYTEDKRSIGQSQKPIDPYANALSDDEYEVHPDHVKTRQPGDGEKDIVDLLFGWTQVINRRMLLQFNYSLSRSDGYQTDPFKMLSVVDTDGLSQRHVYENRPQERTKHSFYWQTKYHFDQVIADVSYRYMLDDWEINSHTIDTRFRIPFGEGHYIEPHVRYYRQQAAEFYQPFINQSDPLPTYASADYRIGAFDAITIGAKYGMKLPSGNSFAVRLEYYNQSSDNQGFTLPGVLNDYSLDPSISAVILQLSYSY